MRKGRLSTVVSSLKPTTVIVLAVICLTFLTNSRALAGTESGDINFAYATWVGSGYYKIGDQRAYILRGNFSWTLRDHDEKNWGVDLLLPATIGYYDFQDLDDVSAITFVPGLQLIYPVKSNWWLKPYGQIGVGLDLSEDDSVLIGGAGIKEALPVWKHEHFDDGTSAWAPGFTVATADRSPGDVREGAPEC